MAKREIFFVVNYTDMPDDIQDKWTSCHLGDNLPDCYSDHFNLVDLDFLYEWLTDQGANKADKIIVRHYWQ